MLARKSVVRNVAKLLTPLDVPYEFLIGTLKAKRELVISSGGGWVVSLGAILWANFWHTYEISMAAPGM